jgi:hypothetical protein
MGGAAGRTTSACAVNRDSAPSAITAPTVPPPRRKFRLEVGFAGKRELPEISSNPDI